MIDLSDVALDLAYEAQHSHVGGLRAVAIRGQEHEREQHETRHEAISSELRRTVTQHRDLTERHERVRKEAALEVDTHRKASGKDRAEVIADCHAKRRHYEACAAEYKQRETENETLKTALLAEQETVGELRDKLNRAVVENEERRATIAEFEKWRSEAAATNEDLRTQLATLKALLAAQAATKPTK